MSLSPYLEDNSCSKELTVQIKQDTHDDEENSKLLPKIWERKVNKVTS